MRLSSYIKIYFSSFKFCEITNYVNLAFYSLARSLNLKGLVNLP